MLLTYREALDEQKRIVNFRNRHYYNVRKESSNINKHIEQDSTENSDFQ